VPLPCALLELPAYDWHRQDVLACLGRFAAAYAWRGQTAEAAAAVAEILKLRPGLTVQQMVEEAWEHSANVTFRKEYQRIAEGVRKAGLPER
jgi:hypothetical protein